jgi:uncharacterized protein (TIGR02452 family)
MPVRISRFLSLVLRHDPGRIGIALDDAGWTDVTALLAACAAHGVAIRRDELAALVASSDKQRFALSPDGERIRANQGHSVEVDLQLAPAEPPATLFHGTVEAALASIRAQGLVRGQRHHVHLSSDLATATRVGGRRGKPVVLTIRAGDMAAAGHTFYRSANGVWLVDHVPPEFILFKAPKGTPGPGGLRGAKSGIAKQTLAACEAGQYTNAHGEAVELAAAIEMARSGTLLHQLGRITVAEQTLAAVEAGRYVNAQHQIVEIDRAAASAADGTVLHEPGEPPRVEARATPTVIEVTGESTLEALIRLHARPGGHLACLNFASAKNPGGGFLGGAQAQEESLARSSALYPCLLRQPAHYARNRAHGSAHYLDLAIYSPRVPFFRDDDGRWLDRPVLASVVTCAAPNASALRQQGKFDAAAVEVTLRRRAALVLAVALHHRVERFVLGAWGAGVFGNDPAMVADAFGALLEGPFAGAFAEVAFAIHGGPGRPNHDAFAARFPHRFVPERG